MKDQLTIQELSAYLPYNLEAKLSKIGIFNLDSEYPNEHQNKICTITNYGFMNGDFYGQMKVNDSNYSFDFDTIDEIDLLLLPISSLTKEVEHKGEKFVPIERLFENIHSDYEKLLKKDLYSFRLKWDTLPYWLIQKLLEWNFDIFGLLDRNLAIDKTTIQ